MPHGVENSASWLLIEFLSHKIWRHNKMVDVSGHCFGVDGYAAIEKPE